MEEREIDVVNMMVDILAHWKSLLIVLLTGGILLGAFSYVRSYRHIDDLQLIEENETADKISVQDKIIQMEEALSKTQVASVENTISMEEKYAIEDKYINNSLYMQIDPLNVAQKELVYQIQAEENYEGKLENVYENIINNVGLYDWVEKQIGMDAGYVGELISTDVKSGKKNIDETQVVLLDSNCVKVVLMEVDTESCERLADAVKEYIEMQQEKISQEVENHKLVLVSETMGQVIRTDIMDYQTVYKEDMNTLKASIATVKDGFTEEQKQYYDLLTQNESTTIDESQEEVAEPVTVQKPSVSIKYVVLGAVVFAFVYAMILCLMYIFNGKLRASDELQNLYHIPQMGLIVKDSKKKLLPDKWVDNLRNHGKRKFTPAQSMELAVAAVKIAAVKNGLDHVCLMGCNLAEGADNVCESIKQALEKEQIAVTILDNVLYNAEAMEKLENEKGVVLVEKAGSTLYNEVSKEIELLTRQDIAVLGGIVVE